MLQLPRKFRFQCKGTGKCRYDLRTNLLSKGGRRVRSSDSADCAVHVAGRSRSTCTVHADNESGSASTRESERKRKSSTSSGTRWEVARETGPFAKLVPSVRLGKCRVGWSLVSRGYRSGGRGWKKLRRKRRGNTGVVGSTARKHPQWLRPPTEEEDGV